MSSPIHLVADDEQQAAIDSNERAVAVLAGPGSGKTLVLSRRAHRLLGGHRDSKALLLTFTNKAAAEMKARVLTTAVVSSDRVSANTFHTFSMQLLRSHGPLVGVQSDFTLLDDNQRQGVCADLTERTGAIDGYYRWSYQRVRRMDVQERLVREFGEAYTTTKREQNVLDFDDLVVFAAELLEANPAVARAYATQYPHILVDEFQDTNAAQFAIVRALFTDSETVSVFADDDQAIYQFAGAESDNVRRFVAELGATAYPLTYNYRCRQAIVTRANRLIAADPLASGRQMRAFYSGGDVRVVTYPGAGEEADGIASDIANLVGEGGADPWDVAVLGRSAARLKSVLAALQRREVPTSNWLAGAYANRERHALCVCLSVIRGRLSDMQAGELAEFLGKDLTDERDPGKLLDFHDGDEAIAALADIRRKAWSGAPVGDVVTSAKQAAVLVDDSLEAGFDELLEAVASFSALDPEFSLEQLDGELALRTSGPPTAGGGVKVASLHRTKGLQWPHVYLLGLEQGCLPDFRSTAGEALREERRTCFVGITRAESHLVLSRVGVDRGYEPYWV